MRGSIEQPPIDDLPGGPHEIAQRAGRASSQATVHRTSEVVGVRGGHHTHVGRVAM
jgi:hypothetical protein